MANEVFANGLEIACKAADGKSVACFPDPCWTPSWSIVPYANTAYAKDTANASKTVFISGKPVMKKDVSYFKTSTGNEPAAGRKGQFTGVKKGKAYFNSWSMDVKVEGKNVDRHTDYTTHNHGSWVGNTALWMYVDTQDKGIEEDCVDDCVKVEVSCGGSSPTAAKNVCKGKKDSSKPDDKKKKTNSKKKSKKNDSSKKSKNWKEKSCDGLMSLKPSDSLSEKELKGAIEKAKKQIETISDNINPSFGDIATFALRAAVTGGGGGGGRRGGGGNIDLSPVIDPEGTYDTNFIRKQNIDSMWGAITGGVSDKIDIVKDGFNKLNKKFDFKKARDTLANAQELQAMADPCLRARKCILTSKSKADADSKNKNPKTVCCSSQTGHHVMPASMFEGKVTDNGCSGYSNKGAPTVCSEGTSHSKGGSHQTLHLEYKEDYKKYKNKTFSKEELIEKGAEQHGKAFPMSNCNKTCIENQLRKGHENVKCKDKMKMPSVAGKDKYIKKPS